MTLSVIVVNYNVKGHLSVCLDSALRAMERLGDRRSELIVFDNASSDGSADWVRDHYPQVEVIASDQNLGFSAGNNEAIRRATGEWILLLNPDTVVPEDTFVRALAHAEAHPRLGALGVPMFDGAGAWLPESKRGMPTPWASFCRLSGLWRWFPKSERFNRYYFGHVGPDETAPVEVLSGAFMWMRRRALEEVGLLDEAFFMYGEDIDLSIRILQGGWENHHLSTCPIVHFKGESTKKGSLSYVRVFHDAMRIFSEKHFAGGQALAMRWMIRLGIQVRAVVAFLRGQVLSRGLGILDVSGAGVLAACWVAGHAGWSGVQHPWAPSAALVLLSVVATLLAGLWAGAYDRPVVRVRVLAAGAMASLWLVVGYSLLPESLRVSRLALGMTSLSLFWWPWVVRRLFKGLRPHALRWRASRPEVGVLASEGRLDGLLKWVEESYGSSIKISIISDDFDRRSLQAMRHAELVLCDAAIGGEQVLKLLRSVGPHGVDVRVVPERLWVALGGRSGTTGPGEVLPLGADGLGRKERRRAKRRVDVFWSVFILIVGSGRGAQGARFTRSMAWSVLLGRQTWLGYHGGWAGEERLPSLPPGVFCVGRGERSMEEEESKRLDLRYAYDVSWLRDLELLMMLRMG